MFFVFLVFLYLYTKRHETNSIWMPEKHILKKDTVKSGKTTYSINIFSISSDNDDSIRYYPRFNNLSKKRKYFSWKRYDKMNNYEKKNFLAFLNHENMDTLASKKQKLLFSGIYSIMKPNNDMHILSLGILDTIHNKFYLIEWNR